MPEREQYTRERDLSQYEGGYDYQAGYNQEADEPSREQGRWQRGGSRRFDQESGGWGREYERGSGPRRSSVTQDRPTRENYAGRAPRGYRRSDERIWEDVCEDLTRHRAIDPSNLEVEVRDAIVTLRGEVEDRYQKRLAEDVAEAVSGVQDVANLLRLQARSESSTIEGSSKPQASSSGSTRRKLEFESAGPQTTTPPETVRPTGESKDPFAPAEDE